MIALELSYLDEWNESRENARANGEAARGREKELARAFSRGSLRLPK